MSYWQAGPPVRASEAWDMLPETLKRSIESPTSTFVAPRYLRLAMGGSHSVYILMRINLHHVGKTLFSYAARLLNQPCEDDENEAVSNNATAELSEVVAAAESESLTVCWMIQIGNFDSRHENSEQLEAAAIPLLGGAKQ